MSFEYPKRNIGWHSLGDGSVKEDVFSRSFEKNKINASKANDKGQIIHLTQRQS